MIMHLWKEQLPLRPPIPSSALPQPRNTDVLTFSHFLLSSSINVWPRRGLAMLRPQVFHLMKPSLWSSTSHNLETGGQHTQPLISQKIQQSPWRLVFTSTNHGNVLRLSYLGAQRISLDERAKENGQMPGEGEKTFLILMSLSEEVKKQTSAMKLWIITCFHCRKYIRLLPKQEMCKKIQYLYIGHFSELDTWNLCSFRNQYHLYTFTLKFWPGLHLRRKLCKFKWNHFST